MEVLGSGLYKNRRWSSMKHVDLSSNETDKCKAKQPLALAAFFKQYIHGWTWNGCCSERTLPYNAVTDFHGSELHWHPSADLVLIPVKLWSKPCHESHTTPFINKSNCIHCKSMLNAIVAALLFYTPTELFTSSSTAPGQLEHSTAFVTHFALLSNDINIT